MKTRIHSNGKNSSVLISLFAGAGGLDIGLELAGFETYVATDQAQQCCETLRANQLIAGLSPMEFDVWFARQLEQRCYNGSSSGEVAALRQRVEQGRGSHQLLQNATIIQGDIRVLASGDLAEQAHVRRGDITLIAGGPPCQPFSRAGKREAVEAEEGRLFMEFVRIVGDLQPRWFLFENVKGLLFAKTEVWRYECGRCASTWLPRFEQRYTGNMEGIPVAACACSARKVRLIKDVVRGGSLDLIVAEFERVGYTCHWKVLNAVDYGAPQFRERLFIVGSRENEPFIWPETTHGANDGDCRQLSFFEPHSGLEKWRTLKGSLWQQGHPVYGDLDSRAVLWLKNVVRPHAEAVTWAIDRPSPTVGAHQGAKFALAPFGVPEQQLLRQQWHTKGRRQRDMPPVPVEHAYLSDLELLRLQTFPESWYLRGTRMERAIQIGNAVPSVLGRAVGGAILAACAEDATACRELSAAAAL